MILIYFEYYHFLFFYVLLHLHHPPFYTFLLALNTYPTPKNNEQDAARHGRHVVRLLHITSRSGAIVTSMAAIHFDCLCSRVITYLSLSEVAL